jgi:tetratricopeptide (TPR) repeat protein
MCEKHWWSNAGPFQPWHLCPTRPDPKAVLLFYLGKRGIKPEEHVAYLMDLLGLQKSMAYQVLQGSGFDAISRCRLLVQALKIPPPLLGIDAKYYPIEHHAYWWRACGFSFHADAQGYPIMSEVVAYLRAQRTQMEDGRVKAWSQEDLGDAADLKKETVYRMEHDRNPLVLESMSRRAIVASALGTLAGENEPTIFRLFGLDPQAYGVPVPAYESVPVVYLPHPLLSDEILQGYHQRQRAFFIEYSIGHAQNCVGEVLEWVKQLEVLLPRVNTIAQHVSLLALQSRNHRFLACIAREQCEKERIHFHTAQAVEWALQALNLPVDGDRARLVTTNELLAAALLTAALAYYELDEYDLAQEHIDQALTLLPTVQSSHLKRHILTDAGLIHASRATTPTDQTLVLSYFDLAAQIPVPGPSSFKVADNNFIRCGNDLLYLRKAMALSAPNMKGVTAEKVLDLLEDAQRLTDPEMIRQHVIIEVFRAWSHFVAGHYQEATEVALGALEKSRLIRSRLNKSRIEFLCKQLISTTYRDKPHLSHLGVKLRIWDHELDEGYRESTDFQSCPLMACG